MANNVRTAEDLERKYNFAEMLGMTKNVKMNEKSITKLENELLAFVSTTTGEIEDLQEQVDGKVETWFYSGAPTLNNQPAVEWINTELKEKHLRDLYYDTATGYAYRFAKEDYIFKWLKITDSDVTEALALANAAQDTADNKRRIFLTQPTPPYDNGDLWVGGSTGDIKACQVSKSSGQAFNINDWNLASKYTDDTKATAIINEMGGTTTTVLRGQVVTIMNNYAKFTDLATGGSTIINGANIKTGTVNTDNVTIGNENVTIDKDGIKLKNGAKVVGENGLMNTYLFTSEDKFKTCGLQGDDPAGISTTTYHKEKVNLIFNIPEGLNIISAKLLLFHAPVHWSYNDINYQPHTIWGYCRNLKLYKSTNINSKAYEAGYMSEYEVTDTSTYEEIVGALGDSGWTPSVPSAASHNTETKISIDLKDKITSGINELSIQTGDGTSGTLSPEQICSKSAFIYAMLKIDGYMSY